MKESIKAMLVRHEASRNYPYRCSAGKLTIGVGRNIEDIGLSNDEIEYLLNNDINRVTAELSSNFEWFRGLSEQRKCAMIDMCFNIGISRLKGFKKMLAAMEAGDYEKAASEAKDSRWYNQVGRRSVEVCAMIRTG